MSAYFVTMGPCPHGVSRGPCTRCQITLSEGLLERELQAKCVTWWHESELPGILFHVPNEGKRGRLEAAALAALGVLAGAPDFVLLLPGGRTHLIELKTPTGEMSSPQRDFASLAGRLDHTYQLVRSLDEFKASATIAASLAMSAAS